MTKLPATNAEPKLDLTLACAVAKAQVHEVIMGGRESSKPQ